MAKKRIKKKSATTLPELRKEDVEKSKGFIYLLVAILAVIALIFIALRSM